MRLYLEGHDYRYAAEQMMLTLSPASGRNTRRRGRTARTTPPG